jgi:hypothetical protein
LLSRHPALQACHQEDVCVLEEDPEALAIDTVFAQRGPEAPTTVAAEDIEARQENETVDTNGSIPERSARGELVVLGVGNLAVGDCSCRDLYRRDRRGDCRAPAVSRIERSESICAD